MVVNAICLFYNFWTATVIRKFRTYLPETYYIDQVDQYICL